MAKVYFDRIMAGTRTYAEVPKKWKPGVKELLIGAVEAGELTPERYEEITGEPFPVVESNEE